MDFITVKDVVKQYSGHRALDGVSMNVPEGCIYGLLGPNGAGKTSLIRILNMITRADAGEVLLNGEPLREAHVENIGYLPEERGLYKKMKVGDHIVYLARLKGMERTAAVKAMHEWLERFDLTEWRTRKVEELSKGMQQKVQFIATVLHRPRLLIFDEPFSGFDPVNAEQLKGEILRLRDEGATILFSTHNMGSVEDVCERITLINKSRVALEGAVKEVKRNHKKNKLSVMLDHDAVLAPAPEVFDIDVSTPGNAVIHLAKGVEMRDAIAFLNEHYPLTGVTELLPTMHEIFIETVTKNQEEEETA
ncbi:MAG: ATP-binding cassette domain-containing protein [Muribaculaceae bacterium]|nr:ATP-binding cassette domain-containing protein [Muribaculaceae bacterium]